MTKILETPLFKYKRIFQQNSSRLQQEDKFLTKQIIKEAHKIPQELKDQYVFLGEQIQNMPFKPELEEWITCPHRLRRYIDGMGVLSFCTNPFHPGFEIGLWNVECSKNNCDLEKICDDDPLLL